MRTKVKTEGVNIIKVVARPADRTNGNIYGIRGQFTGEMPAMILTYGDDGRKGDDIGFYTWDLDDIHEYPKDPSYSYLVTLELSPNNIIDHIEPCCGDCEYEFVDLSGARDIISAYIKSCKGVALRNPRMEKLELNIEDFPNVEFFWCSKLRELTFSGGKAVKELDLSYNHNLERLVIKGYDSSDLKKINFAKDVPLKYIDITGLKLHPSCLKEIRRIIERNGGEIIGDHKSSDNKE